MGKSLAIGLAASRFSLGRIVDPEHSLGARISKDELGANPQRA